MEKEAKGKIAIIGGGAGGVMGALRGTLNGDQVLLFPGSPKHKKKSRAFWVSKIENMPGHFEYKKGIDNPNKEAIDWIESSAFKDNFQLFKNRGIEEISKKDGFFHLVDNKGDEYFTEYVVLATGVMDIQPEINGEIKPVFPYANNQSIDYCLRCDGHHVHGQKTGIIGHSDVALWVAIMLYERYEVPSMSLFLNGESPLFDESTLEIAQKYGIKIINEKIIDVLGEPKEGKLEGFKLESGETIPLGISFVSLGMLVYNELAKKLGADLDKRGFVLGNNKGETNVENLYVAGDLRANTKKQVYTAWDTSVDALDDINAKIRRYKRSLL